MLDSQAEGGSPEQRHPEPPREDKLSAGYVMWKALGPPTPTVNILHFLSLVVSFTTENSWRTRNIWILPRAKNKTHRQKRAVMVTRSANECPK